MTNPSAITSRNHVGIATVAVSLEQRLTYLERALERLQKVRGQMEHITERLSQDNPLPSKSPAVPSPTDLSARFGETIMFVQENVETLELLVSRLDCALFDALPEAVQVDRAR